MTNKVCDLLFSLNVPVNSYNAILSEFDYTYSYLNDILISISREVEKNKAMLYNARKKLEEKKLGYEA